MKKISFILLGALICTFSCQSKAPKQIGQLFNDSIALELSDVDIPSAAIASPYVAGGVVDNKLVLVNRFEDKLLSIYNLQNNYAKTALLNRGHANNEMLNIMKMSCYDNKIYLTGSPNKMIILDWEQIHDSLPKLDIVNQEVSPLSNIIPVGDQYYAAMMLDSDTTNNLICLMDRNFNVINRFGTLSSYNEDLNMPHHDQLMGLQGKLASSNDKRSMIYTSNFGSIISFFKLSENGVSKIKEYIFEIPKFKSVSKPGSQTYGVAQNSKNICGTISLNVNQGEYFLLYSNKQMGDDQAYTSNLIYVFDSEGSPVRKYILSESVKAIIGFDNKNIYLYGNNSNDEPLIKKAQL